MDPEDMTPTQLVAEVHRLQAELKAARDAGELAYKNRLMPEGVANILSHAVNRGLVTHGVDTERTEAGWYSLHHRPSELAQAMVKDHPTLQQEKMRLFLQFCTLMAQLPYVDARNEASHILAQAIYARCQDVISLPFI